MTLDWAWLGPGLLLLWFPADRLLPRAIALRTFEELQNLHHHAGESRWWSLPALWLDPLRAFAGTWLIHRGLELSPLKWSLVAKPEFAVLCVALVVGFAAQLFERTNREAIFAPIGYAIGLIAALVPWPVTLIGLTTGMTAVFGVRRFAAFFVVGAIAVAALGLALKVPAPWRWLAAGLLVLPALAALVTGRRLEVPTRAAPPETDTRALRTIEAAQLRAERDATDRNR